MPRIVKKVIKLLYPHKVAVFKDLEDHFIEAATSAISIENLQQRGFYSDASAPPADNGFILNYNFTQNNHVHPTAPPLQIEVVTNGLIYNVD